MCRVIDFLFDDKRVAVICLTVWMCVVLSIFYEIGILEGKFMQFGPSEHTIFMSIPINTWYRYFLVSLFTFVNTCVNDFMSDAISPWLLNTITDHKSRYIPYSKAMCITISQFWSVYCNIMSIFNVFLSLTQIDFVIIRTVADLIMSMYTNLKFLRYKVHNESKYNQTMQHVCHDDGEYQQRKMAGCEQQDRMMMMASFSIDGTELEEVVSVADNNNHDDIK